MASRRDKIFLGSHIAILAVGLSAAWVAGWTLSPEQKAKRLLHEVSLCGKPVSNVEKLLTRSGLWKARYRTDRYAVSMIVGFEENEIVGDLVALGPAATEALIEAARDPDRNVRVCAMRVLTDNRDPRAFEILVSALEHEDYLTRAGAILSLGVLGDPRALEPLVEQLDGPEGYLAALALGRLGDQRAVQPLIDAVPMSPAGHGALRALGRLSPQRAVGPFTDALDDALQGDDKYRTRWLLETLAELGCPLKDPRLPGLLARAAGHSFVDVRFHAAKALGRTEHARAAEPLRGLLTDPDVRVRKAAAEGLTRLESPDEETQEQPRLAG